MAITIEDSLSTHFSDRKNVCKKWPIFIVYFLGGYRGEFSNTSGRAPIEVMRWVGRVEAFISFWVDLWKKAHWQHTANPAPVFEYHLQKKKVPIEELNWNKIEEEWFHSTLYQISANVQQISQIPRKHSNLSVIHIKSWESLRDSDTDPWTAGWKNIHNYQKCSASRRAEFFMSERWKSMQ